MKINSIYIHAFGKLKNFSLNLNDGLNVIYGENENGKTTVMAFIRMMFYGTEGKRAHNLSSKPRVKYLPWSGETMGGRIEFEHRNKRYRLEREFKKSDSTDRIVLTDLDLGKEVKFGNLGADFFGISASAFDRSVFIDTFLSGGKDGSAEGEINSKLSTAFVSNSEDVSFDTVASRIESARNDLISKSKKTGKYVKNSEKLKELNERLEISERKARERLSLTDKANALKNEYIKHKKEYDILKKKLSAEQDVKDAKKLTEYLDTKEELDRIKEKAMLNDGSFADEMFVKSVEFCINRLSSQNERVNDLEKELERFKNEISLSKNNDTEELNIKADECEKRIAGLSEEKEELKRQIAISREKFEQKNTEKQNISASKKPINIPLFVIGLILAVVLGGVLGPIVKSVFGSIVSFALGAIIIALSFILKGSNKNSIFKLDTEINSLSAELLSLNAKLSETEGKITEEIGNRNLLASAINMSLSKKESRLQALSEREQSLLQEKNRQKNLENKLFEVYARLRSETDIEKIKESIPEINETAEKIKTLKLRLKYLSEDLGGISYAEAENKLQNISDFSGCIDTDFEAEKLKLESLGERLNEIRNDITATVTTLKSEFKNYEEPENLKREIEELDAVMKSQKEFCDSADIALEVLEQSFAEVRRSYGSELEKKTLSIFNRLTNDRYNSLSISKGLDISVEPEGTFGTREVEYLSQGAFDQAYLSLRLAIAELISEDESLPVILDDALSQYDDIRLKNAMSFLKEYSKNSQAILFTCHGFIKSVAKELNIPVLEEFN